MASCRKRRADALLKANRMLKLGIFHSWKNISGIFKEFINIFLVPMMASQIGAPSSFCGISLEGLSNDSRKAQSDGDSQPRFKINPS